MKLSEVALHRSGAGHKTKYRFETQIPGTAWAMALLRQWITKSRAFARINHL
jgi:hypothetical protein